MYLFDCVFYDKQTGLHSKMQELMQNPNHNRTLIKISVLHVRNYKTGRGLRDLTWSLLLTIAQKNQHLAMDILKTIIVDGHGTWKDPRNFTEFCFKYGFKDLLVPSMDLYVKQLIIDLDVYAKLSSNDIPRVKLSYAAKYAPRERSWMHSTIMSLWNQQHYLCNQIGNGSMDKCCMIYRQTISALNRALETTEIAMCNKEWHNININKTPLHTQLKHRQCFNKNIPNYDTTFIDNRVIPLWMVIKYAYENPNDKDMWNEVWNNRTKHLTPNTYAIPLLELSKDIYFKNNMHLFYKAIEKTLLMAKQSLFGYFAMVFSHQIMMIDLSKSKLTDAIELLYGRIVFSVEDPCVACCSTVLIDAFIHAGIDDQELQHASIKLITHKEISNLCLEHLKNIWKINDFTLSDDVLQVYYVC